MNIIKKYWDSVYIYVLLAITGLCMCAGAYWTGCKLFGLYPKLGWLGIIVFDCSQLVYLAVAIYFIYSNKKNSSYIAGHMKLIKGFIVLVLFIQYNFIMYLFPSTHVWECTVLFYFCIMFFFDSKLMAFNIVLYLVNLLVIHILRPEDFLPLESANLTEFIAYRILMCTLISASIMLIVYLVERFLMQAKQNDEENVHLMEKQLNYYKDMELLDTELRKFRHDIKNHFICMESLFNNGKTEELQEYFRDLQQDFPYERKMYFSGNDIIDAILHHDLQHYCDEKVNIVTYGILPNIKTVSAMDLCTVFSNLLSNAIASANKCTHMPNPQLVINFSGGSRYFCIAISNSIAPLSVVEKKNKDRNHGYGVNKIKNVLEKYSGRYEQNIDGQMLTIEIYLPV